MHGGTVFEAKKEISVVGQFPVSPSLGNNRQ